jgi:hypothetical protein
MPARQNPAADHEQVMVTLGHHGGTNIRPPEADLGVLPGGGKNSINTIDTTDGTAAGTVVMSPSALSNNGQNFGIWLRHQ